MAIKLFDRIATLVKADAHGLVESLEERSLLLKQYVREAEIELNQKRARLEALREEEKRLREALARRAAFHSRVSWRRESPTARPEAMRLRPHLPRPRISAHRERQRRSRALRDPPLASPSRRDALAARADRGTRDGSPGARRARGAAGGAVRELTDASSRRAHPRARDRRLAGLAPRAGGRRRRGRR